MQDLTYLVINLGALSAPFFGRLFIKTDFAREIRAFNLAFMKWGVPFIVWDFIATHRGHWDFNSRYTLDLRILGLPLEELLFFYCIPFACLYLYSVISELTAERKYKIPSLIFGGICSICITISLFNYDREYTSFVFLLAAFVLGGFYWKDSSFLTSKRYLLFMLITFILFLIFNSILAGLPVVTYDESERLSLKIGVIGIEDFIYNWILLTGFLWFYTEAKEKRYKSSLTKLNFE